MTPDHQRSLLFIAGLLALIYVLVAFPVDRDPWPFVVLIGGMLGIPAFTRLDRQRNGHREQPATHRGGLPSDNDVADPDRERLRRDVDHQVDP